MIDIAQFLKEYLKEIEAGNAAVFVGAGLSVSAGYVDWSKLLAPLASELGLDIERETDFVSLAQFYVNTKGGRGKINQRLVNMVPAVGKPTENHILLSRLPIETFWTTNYDDLIETALKSVEKIPDVKFTVPQLAITVKNRDAVVYKMHGDIAHPDKAILTKDDFEKYSDNFQPFINALQGDLVERTFLFLGIGFNDPNLDHILSRVRAGFSNNQREHYTFQKRRIRGDREDEASFRHAQVRQSLMIEDLKRFNIQTVLVDEYEDVTRALRQLEQRYRRRTVFVSSSASTFEPWGEQAVVSFMLEMGKQIGQRDLRLATGMGLGVGNALFTGVLDSVSRKLGATLEEHITIRPFPQHIDDATVRARVWSDYRRDLISRAGIAIFLFGNKPGEDIASGITAEYDIAQELGLICLPLGGTGYAAKSLKERALKDSEQLPADIREKVRDALHNLSEPTTDLLTLIKPMMAVLDTITERSYRVA